MQETPEPTTPAVAAPTGFPCRHLRNKEMYYQGAEEDACSSGIYWCARTQEALGPDGLEAGKNVCCTGRGCYLI